MSCRIVHVTAESQNKHLLLTGQKLYCMVIIILVVRKLYVSATLTGYREMFYFLYDMEISAGYKYYVDNLVAIARLRGDTLKTLRIAAQDILYDVTEPSIIEELSLGFVQVLGTSSSNYTAEVCTGVEYIQH